MFRVKSTRKNVKRTASPIRPTSDPYAAATTDAIPKPVAEPVRETLPTIDKQYASFFEAESAATALSKPWLRLDRGMRLQKYRAFAEAYPGLSEGEKDTLYKMLLKANDAKLLNTKTQVQYEHGVIQAVHGLKIIRTGDPTVPATFKIEVPRATKRNTDSDAKQTPA